MIAEKDLEEYRLRWVGAQASVKIGIATRTLCNITKQDLKRILCLRTIPISDMIDEVLCGRKAIEALEALQSNEHIDLEDMVYTVHEHEGKGWEGPSVVQWSEAVRKAKEIVQKKEGSDMTPYQKGLDAADRKKTAADCPYEYNSIEGSEWLQGFQYNGGKD